MISYSVKALKNGLVQKNATSINAESKLDQTASKSYQTASNSE